MKLSPLPLDSSLHAHQLSQDPRIQKGFNEILNAVKEQSQKITEIKSPNGSLKIPYEQLLQEFSNARGGDLWYPYVGSGIGNGALVELCDGSVKYDFISGIGPHFFGHSHELMIKASLEAACCDTIMQGHLQQTGVGFTLCQLLLDAAGWKKEHCFVTTSGVMAVENGLKIAFHNRHPANRVLAFEKCFAGRTLGAAQITDKAAYRTGLPDTIEVDYIPFFDENDPEGSTQKALTVLENHLNRYPGKHAVFCMEPVQGEAGFRIGSSEYFKALIKRCKEHNILILADEVQTFARLPTLFAFQHFDLSDHVDIVTVGKVLQVCATLYRSDLKPKGPLLSQTFTGATASLYAAQAVVEQILNGGYLGENGHTMRLYRYMTSQLDAISKRIPGAVSGPYGIGGMVAFTPFDGDASRTLELSKKLYENGLIAFIAGSNPTRIRFLPPIGALDEKTIDGAFAILEQTLKQFKKNV